MIGYPTLRYADAADDAYPSCAALDAHPICGRADHMGCSNGDSCRRTAAWLPDIYPLAWPQSATPYGVTCLILATRLRDLLALAATMADTLTPNNGNATQYHSHIPK